MEYRTTTTSLEKAKKLLTMAASVATTAVLVRSVVNDYLPDLVRDHIDNTISDFFSRKITNDLTIVVDQFDAMVKNDLYEAASVYLGTLVSDKTKRLKASMSTSDSKTLVTVDKGEVVVDEFEGVSFRWQLVSRLEKRRPRDRDEQEEIRHFELCFNRKHNDLAVNRYLPFVMQKFKDKNEADQTIELHMLRFNRWYSVDLNHPSTFDTLALDPDMKRMIVSDLDRFVKAKDYYRKVGKAWKRGYLLYGPPGTGKSSLIAAMANHLKYDIYDLELTKVCDNTTLRSVLLATSSKSIIVVEDIDCTIDLKNRETLDEDGSQSSDSSDSGNEVTLSGLLNAIDGLWSCCGDQRIIVFTTNHKDRLDPALIRPGRMDMHIHMSYCTPAVFRVLISNYHSGVDHVRFAEIEKLITEVEVTPAEVAGELMKSGDVDVALGYLIDCLDKKRVKLLPAAQRQLDVI